MKHRILFLSLLSLLQFVAVHFLLLQHFPNSGDEQAFLFQGRLFSHGQLYVEDPIYDRSHPLHKFVHADALDDVGGRRFPKYDPGWAIVLAPFAIINAEWLAAPLLGALTVFLLLTHVNKRIGKEFVASMWWLVTLCSFFFLSVANYGNHTLTMAILLGVFMLYDATADRLTAPSPGRLFFIGLLLGYCSLVRYLDWIPLMVWIGFDLLRQRKFNRLILVLLGFGLLASCNLLYDKLLTGNALLPPAIDDARHYTGVQRLGASLGFSWHGFPVTGTRLLRTVYAFPPAVLVLLCLFRRCRSVQFNVCTVLCALGVSIYFLYAWTPAGPGPRYYFPYFPLLFLAVIEAYRLNRDWTVAQIGWPLALAALVICSSVYATDQTLEIYRRRDLERTVATLPETKKIILLETGTYKMEIPDLVRNPIDLWSADTLYFDYTDRAGLDDLLRRFPKHAVYVYHYPGSLTPWEHM
jgi:hypothetical protein